MSLSRHNKRLLGFTMIEVMLSIALLVSIAGASAIALNAIDQSASIDRTASTIVSALRRAELRSIGMEDGTPWGVNIAANSIVVYRGASYETRSQSSDEIIELPSSITAAGLGDIHFAGATGKPSIWGDMTLATNYETRTITVERDGTILY